MNLNTKTAARRKVKAWLEINRPEWIIKSITHIYPTCYVIGQVSPGQIVAVRPWMEAEPLCRETERHNPLAITSIFDRSLKAQDWCISAYICVRDKGGYIVLVP